MLYPSDSVLRSGYISIYVMRKKANTLYYTILSPTQPTCDQTCIDSRTQKKPCIEGPFSFSICGGIYSVHTYAVNFQ